MKGMHGERLRLLHNGMLYINIFNQDELLEIRGMVFDMCSQLEAYDPIEFDTYELMGCIRDETLKVVGVFIKDAIVAMGLVKILPLARGNKSLLVVGAVGFERLSQEICLDVLFLLEDLCIKSGCIRLEWYGRPGWERVFRGFKKMKKRIVMIDEVT
jgi:hypothetical protein